MFTSGHKQFECLTFTIVCRGGGGGGEEMGQPVSSPPSKLSESKILIVLCYQLYSVHISTIELIGLFLPHLTTKHFSGLTNYCLGGGGAGGGGGGGGGGGEEMGRPVSSPPSKLSESKILIVLCYQLYSVHISTIELIGLFLPHLTTKHFSGLTNYCLGGGKKWAGD